MQLQLTESPSDEASRQAVMGGLQARRQTRVALLASEGADGKGGIGRQLTYLTRYLRECVADVDPIVLRTRYSDRAVLKHATMPLALAAFVLACLVRRIDVVHINVAPRGSTWRKALFQRAALAMGRPVILHLHGSGYDDFYAGLDSRRQAAVRRMFRRASRVVSLSGYWTNFLQTTLQTPRDRIVEVPNGVPAAPAPRRKPSSSAPPVLLFLGQVGHRKGVDVLLQALQGLRAEGLAWRAVIAGDGEVEQAAATAAAMGLGEQVEFAGWVNEAGANDLLAAADIFVLPSRAENQPVAILEAMAHGLPVVATAIGAIPEQVADGESGLLAPAGDAGALQRALSDLLRSPERRRQMGEAGRRRFQAQFSLASTGERIAAVYRALGGGNARSPDRRSIVFLVSHSSQGGAAAIWENLAEGFRGLGFQVQLVALYPFYLPIQETSKHLPWVHILEKRPTRPHEMAQLLWAMVRFFRTERPEVVFSALPAANVLTPLLATASLTGTKVVTSHHSEVDTYSPALNLVDGLVSCLPAVTSIISVSDSVRRSQDRRPRLYRAKRRTIHNALPPQIEAHLEELAARREGARQYGRKVVATGRLVPQKNYPVLVRAAAQMPDVTIQIIGEGQESAALEALCQELGVRDRIQFLGYKPRLETLALLAAGDVFVQPSLFEGHSLGLIEAAKLGLPLVVSDAPVQIEGVTAKDGELCGIVVPTHDADALAAALLRLLNDRDQREMWAARARRLAAGASFKATLNTYRDLIP